MLARRGTRVILRGAIPAAAAVVAAGTLQITGCDRSQSPIRASRVDTTPFDGRYRLIAEESFAALRTKLAVAEQKANEHPKSESPDARQNLSEITNVRMILKNYEDQYANFIIRRGVIRSGATLVQEFSLNQASISDGKLVGIALWHEDIHDPGDCIDQPIQLELRGGRLVFSIGDEANGVESPVVFERVAQEP